MTKKEESSLSLPPEDPKLMSTASSRSGGITITATHGSRVIIGDPVPTTCEMRVGIYITGLDLATDEQPALLIVKKVFGVDESVIALYNNNLSDILQALTDVADARAPFERTLHIFEEVFGPEHPNTRIVREYLEALPK